MYRARSSLCWRFFLDYMVYGTLNWVRRTFFGLKTTAHNRLSLFTVRLMTMNRYMTIADIKHLCNYVPLRNPVEAWESTIQSAVSAEQFHSSKDDATPHLAQSKDCNESTASNSDRSGGKNDFSAEEQHRIVTAG